MTFTSVNPHDPADVIGEWDAAGEREVAAAVEQARQGADTWRRTPAAARAAALTAAAAAVEQRAAEVTALTVREVGKPVIGIANSWSDLNPCNLQLRDLAVAVSRGVLQAGGIPA